jgi:hypothetical protein
MAERPPVRSTAEVLKDLEALASTMGYMHVLAEITSRDLFLDIHEAATINWRERITFQELTLMVGLTLKAAPLSYDELSQDVLEQLISKTRLLLDELHRSYNDQFFQVMSEVTQADGGMEALPGLSEEKKDQHFKKLFGSSASMIEATFYNDSGSYDFQYLEMAPRLYQYDADWLTKAGMDFEKSAHIYRAIKHMVQAMHHGKTHPELIDAVHKGGSLRAMDEFAFPKSLILKVVNDYGKNDGIMISEAELEKFLELFSSKPEDQFKDFTGPGDLNIVSIKPIIEIGDDIYFIPVEFNLAEAVYQSPAYWMRQDAAYLETAAKNRGRANEQITYEYFQKIFGELAFKSLKVVKGKKTLTDIDVMGVIGSVAVVVQNKGKKMTIEALRGNEEILKSDFKQAIQSAYDQGIQSRDVLLGEESYKFIDEDGNEVVLPQGIEQVCILCITTDVYPAALHQLSVYLEKEKDQPWPLAMSLFDLDAIATYLDDPYEFAFYVKQRVELTEVTKSSGEMAYLGYHLKQGLFKPDGADMFMIDQDYAQLVDADYMYRKGQLPEPSKDHPLISDWSNSDYDQLLNEFKTNVDDPRLTDIIFYLKTIPPHIIDGITQVIKRTRKKAEKDGLPHNFSMPITDENKPWGGFSYVMGRTPEEVRMKLGYVVQVNKYKHKSKYWLGVGAIVGERAMTNSVLFGWDEWEQSDEMDKLIEYHDANAKGFEVSLKALEKERKREGATVKRKPKKAKNQKKAARKARKLGRRANKR